MRIRPAMCFAVALVALLSLGWALRRTGIDHGRPHLVYHPDVAKQTLVASRLYRGDSDIRRLYRDDFQRTLYPYGDAVILGRGARLVGAITGRRDLDNVHRWVWALRMRYLASLLYLAAVGGVCLFLYRGFGTVSALTAGWLLVTEPIAAQYSHYGMNDVPLTAWLLVAWVFSGMMAGEPHRVPVFSLLTGLTLGMAFGTKYQGVLGGLFPMAAWIAMATPRRKGRHARLAGSVAAVMVGGALGVAFSCPLLVRNPAYFFQTIPDFMRWQAHILDKPLPFGPKVTANAVTLAGLLLSGGQWLLMVGAAALSVNLFRRWKGTAHDWALRSAAAFCAVLAALLVLTRDFVRANDLIPLLAFASLLVAALFDYARPIGTRTGRVALALALSAVTGLALTFTWIATLDGLALARCDTRERAQRWCAQHLPEGAVVVRERYTLPPRRPDVRDIACRYLSEVKAEDLIHSGRCGFAMTSSLAHDRFFDPHSPYYSPRAQAIYACLRETAEPVAIFEDRRLFYAHPRIVVYALKPGL